MPQENKKGVTMLNKIRESCEWTRDHLEGIWPDENTMTKEEIIGYYEDYRDINNKALRDLDTLMKTHVLIKITDVPED